MIEILITAAIVAAAGYIFIKSLKKKANGKCDSCTGGSAHCPMCEEKRK